MKKANSIKIILNLDTYPLEVIYQASHIFLDRAYVFLDSQPSGKVLVQLNGKNKLSKSQSEKLKGEFLNELLNSALRLEIAKRNKKIREAIIGQALLSALREDEMSFQDDPLGIAVPWEEKYGKDKKSKARNPKSQTNPKPQI